MNPLLKIEQLSIDFPGHRAVHQLDLTLHSRELLALVGESGCGKSTTALAIPGLLPPQARRQGRILFDGVDLLTRTPQQLRALRGSQIAMIFQEPMTSLHPVHTLGSQLIETLTIHQPLSRAAARRRAIELLDLVRIPSPHQRIDSYAHQLSGGQRQRVMIAMAVACEPRLLIADEPTTALDVTVQQQILELLDNLRQQLSMGVLLITHDLGLVAERADRVAVMVRGEKVEEAGCDRLFADPQHPYTRGLIASSLHHQDSLHYPQQRLTEIRQQPDATSQTAFSLFTPPVLAFSPRDPHAAPLLSVRHLSTDYVQQGERIRAVDDVSFDLSPGETLGLVGESGCGKSTLSRTLLRLLKPAEGEILLAGVDISQQKPAQLQPLRDKVQMIFQDPYGSLNPRRSVGAILDSVLRVKGVMDARLRDKKIRTMLDRVGLAQNSVQRYPHEFSGGQRQRIGIARALIVEPELVICDEAVSALDVSVQAQILNLLVALKHEMSLSYLFISHDLAVVRYIADRVMVMQQGKIVESAERTALWQAPRHPYTRQLMTAVPGAGRYPWQQEQMA